MRLILLLLVSVALVGCGEGDGVQEAAESSSRSDLRDSKKEACSLLTLAEVTAAVGNPVADGKSMGTRQCTWDSEELEETSFGLLTMLPQPGSRPAMDVCDDLRSGAAGMPGGITDMDGPGDRAWWNFTSAPMLKSGQLTSCSERGVLILNLTGGAGEERMLAAARSLAQKLLSRI